ncbi:MAG: sigma-70 region 4 domain-containing protein [Proteobacteria bacterium]|nr:sigma-70 region 4 domain-containing protein [Pseudomonadota bacterium]
MSKENSKLYKLETLLRSLPPNLREVVLLRERFGFALDEVAEIMNTAPSDIEVLFAQGLSSLEQGMQELATKVPQLLIDLKPFTKMLHDGPETQNLSNIINDFKKTNSITVTRTKWLFRLFFGVAAVLAWVYKEEIVEFSHTIRNHFNS